MLRPKAIAASLIALFMIQGAAFAASTGKIFGTCVDAENQEALIGVNVILEGTSFGASTDLDGNFFILNVPPGDYTLKASMLSYTTVIFNNVKVSSDRTTSINAKLAPTIMEAGEEVTYIAKRPMIQKDMTDSRTTRTAEDMKLMPVENIVAIVRLSAGIVGNNFRGGRASEVSYIVDGASMVDPMTGTYEGFIPQVSFAEVNVITGGQSVEYGNALSGVVNQITKEGADRIDGNLSIRSNDMGEDEAFVGERDRMKDLQGSVSGPVPLFNSLRMGSMYYLFSGQYFDTQGRFENDDSTLTSSFGKVTYKLSPKHKLTFSGAVSNAQYTFFGQGSDENLWSRTTFEDRLGQFEPIYLENGDLDPGYVYLDANGNPWYDNGLVDSEDLNRNGVIDPGEDLDGDGAIDTEDLNHNFQLDAHNMFNHVPYYEHHTEQFSAKWNHTLSARTFYELNVSRYKTQLHYNSRERFNEDTNGNEMLDLELKYSTNADVPQEIWDEYRDYYKEAEGFVFFDFNQNGEYDYEDLNGNEIWDWDVYGSQHDLFQDNDDDGYIDASQGNPSDEWLRWQDINFFGNTKDNDDFMNYGSGKTYDRARWGNDYKIVWNIKGNVTSQMHKYHQIKSGIDLQFIEIFDHDVDMASGGNVYGQNVNTEPRLYGFWLEDKMEFEGMVINAGVRFDVFDINFDQYPADIEDPVLDPVNGGEVKNPVAVDPKYYWGPRLGVAFPITDRDLLSFNYSRNFQIPILRYAFTNVNWDFSGAFPLIGNVNLEPERTTSYELTVRHQFTPDMAMVGTGFYKDISGLTDTRQVYYDPRNWYGLYINLDYGNVRGFELSLEKRFSSFYSGTVNYTYSVSKGKASSARQNYQNAWAENVIRTTESYLDWDQRHTVNGTIQLMVPRGTKPFNMAWMDEWMLSLIGRYGSGLPFTSPSRDKDPPINDQRLPFTLTFDGRVQKRYSFNDNFAALIYLQGYNIFDRQNIDQDYFQTYADAQWYMFNDADNNGEPDKDVDGLHDNPLYWERSRSFQFGIGFEF
ncbi:MAG: TonB-dependent receptor [Candidatus Electryonea clarkiae]|nr:TonB-dependent receptor [Candidatus Electryonea clarkiae]MDP8287406.1 TonB-dependent receptor [Candidatus Electryonea clarkiae]